MDTQANPLHLLGLSWLTPYEARLFLSTDPTALGAVDWDREATCIAYVRVSHDSAPGYCAESVELADVDGDASGLDEWLSGHEAELLNDGGRL